MECGAPRVLVILEGKQGATVGTIVAVVHGRTCRIQSGPCKSCRYLGTITRARFRQKDKERLIHCMPDEPGAAVEYWYAPVGWNLIYWRPDVI